MRIAASIIIAGIAGGCGLLNPHPTPYQPLLQQSEFMTALKGKPNGGYRDFDVPGKPGLHYVIFHGNGYTGRSDVVLYWHRRAAEICANAYEIESMNINQNVEISSSSPVTQPVQCTGGGNTGLPVQCIGGGSVGGGTSTVRFPFM